MYLLYLRMIQRSERLKKHMDDEVRIQTDYFKFEKQFEVTGMQFNNSKKSKVLHLGKSNRLHNYRMRNNSSAEKGFMGYSES